MQQTQLDVNRLPPAPDFGWPVPLSGNWRSEPEIELPGEDEFASWELSLAGNVQLEPDGLDVVALPPCEAFEFQMVTKPKPPDISKGLGQRKDRTDLVNLQKFVAGSRKFMILNGDLCLYRPPYWKKLTDLEAEREIRALIEECEQGYCLTHREYTQLRKGLLCDPNIPCKTGEIIPASGKINFLDGTFDINTSHFLPHNPDDGFFSALNLDFRDARYSSGQAFEEFAAHISNGNPDVREQLLQLVALTIIRKPLKHFFVLLGPSNTGKTQFGRFLEELVGHEQTVCVRDIHDFDDRWTTSSLEGKTLALCLDLPDAALPPRAVGIIKQLVGDDSIKAEKKYREPYTYHHKPLLVLAGNHPLRISGIDQETALLNRMVTICFQNPVLERDMRQELYRDLLEEAPYIVGEAIQAYYRLEQNNFEVMQVPVPKEYAPQDGRSGYRSIANFLEEQCEFTPDAEITTQALFDAYCESEGSNSPQTNKTDFSRNIRELLAKCSGVEALKRVEGREQRGYRGIRLLK